MTSDGVKPFSHGLLSEFKRRACWFARKQQVLRPQVNVNALPAAFVYDCDKCIDERVEALGDDTLRSDGGGQTRELVGEAFLVVRLVDEVLA